MANIGIPVDEGGGVCCFLPGCVSMKLKEMGPFLNSSGDELDDSHSKLALNYSGHSM